MDEAEILSQLAALVEDSSQSISYKWLSRKFSVSSNAAKRLLEKFVDAHSGRLDVVYVLAGWTQEQPRSYAIKLVKRAQLEGAKASLREDSSVHVYSVQGGSSGDPALLWNPDHAQAQQLFNDPPHVLNCLRDNRFSGVTCSFVTRDLKVKSVQQVPPKPAPVEESKAVSKQPDQPSGKTEAARATHSSPPKVPGSSKAPLQNLWNARKQSPPKPVVPDATTENNGSSDDELKDFARLRRGVNKRRVIFDDEASEGDEEPNEPNLDEEGVVSLITPEKKVEDKKKQSAEQSNNSKAGDLARNDTEAGESKKRRRLVKTRTDERGREVMEVVWDTEGQQTTEAKPEIEKPKPEAPPPPPPPPPPAKQPQPVKSKAAVKPGPKSGKGGKAGAQQGSITSFFKKQ